MDVIFVIDSQADRRAEVCRVLLSGDGHAEPFETVEEFLAFSSSEGMALVYDDNGSAARLCAKLRDNPRLVPVIGYREEPVVEDAVAAMRGGTVSYLAWPFSTETFATEIGRIEPLVRADLDARRRTAKARSLLAGLTAREKEVLVSLITHGTNKAIAKRLDISPRTVEKYRAAILVRLGVTSSAQAIRIAVESGVFSGVDFSAGADKAERAIAEDGFIG